MAGNSNSGQAQLQGQHLFTPIAHPELCRLGQKRIHAFLRERERYLLHINDAQATGSSISAISLKSSLDPDLLLSLVEFDEFDGVISVNELSEEALKNWLDDKETVNFDTLTTTELENSIRPSVRMKINEKDPELRIKALFVDYKTFLRVRRWGDLIHKNAKQSTAHICTLLKPPALKEKIENDLSLSKHDLKKDWMQFYRYAVNQAVRCDEFVSIRQTPGDADARTTKIGAEKQDKTRDGSTKSGNRNGKSNNDTYASTRKWNRSGRSNQGTRGSSNSGSNHSTNSRSNSAGSGNTGVVRELPF